MDTKFVNLMISTRSNTSEKAVDMALVQMPLYRHQTLIKCNDYNL
jgi:hypothetical protein